MTTQSASSSFVPTAAAGSIASTTAGAAVSVAAAERGVEREERDESDNLRVARARAAALLAVDREIESRHRRQRRGGLQPHTHSPQGIKKKRELLFLQSVHEGGDDYPKKKGKKSIRIQQHEAVLPCGRSSASQALVTPFVPTVTKKNHARIVEARELEEIARKLRRHNRSSSNNNNYRTSRSVGKTSDRASA
jgi:hypothetical protein